jgi:superfamily II DNA or RNA helicase
VERLLRERRAVLEQASAKVHRLRAILQDQDRRQPVRRTLIYTSAKPSVFHDMRQIDQVNGMLSDLGIVSHQFTSDETSRVDASAILERFGTGDYQVLTAMKVLDEGVDIPQTDTAFILASSTVRREWVQRRGRVLRKAPGKSVASIHDFFVIPPNPTSPTGQAIIRAELRRLREFTDDCDNEWATDGPRSLIGKYEGQGL